MYLENEFGWFTTMNKRMRISKLLMRECYFAIRINFDIEPKITTAMENASL
jgi:hypothetical protein